MSLDLNNFGVLVILIFGFLSVCYGAPQTFSTGRTLLTETMNAIPGPQKNYTGIRVRNDSFLMIYFHDQTIAVVELNVERELFTCELLEVRTNEDQRVTLNNLKPYIPSQIKISFADMKALMNECQKLDTPKNVDWKFLNDQGRRRNRLNAREFTSLLSGVFPGTKWCGSGDLAISYYDLGSDEPLDRCCRTHDLCPVKVAGFKANYDIMNYSLYTKSHCECDEMFYYCLRAVDSSRSNFIGNIYFNVARIECIEDVPNSNGKKRFSNTKKKY